MADAVSFRPRNPFRVLAEHRNYRLFWLGQTVSLMGSWMQAMGEGWLALQLTNSAFMVGLTATVAALPVLLLSLHGGVLADRRDKLRLVTIAQSLLLLQATLLWWFVWSGHITVWLLLALALVSGTIGAFEVPARQAMLIELVTRDDLPDAIALNSGGFNLARVIGPSVAGIVIHQFGVAWCFAVNAASYLAVLASLLRIRLPPRIAPSRVALPLDALREGLLYIKQTPNVSILMRLAAVYGIFGVPYLALMPVLARDVLHGGAGGYGLLLSAVGIGGLSGALGLAALGDRVRRGRLLEMCGYAFGVLLILFALSRSLVLATVLSAFVGFFMILTNALANALLQTVVPDALRGRVMAAYIWVAVGLAPVVGPFLAGTAAERIGAAAAVAIGAGVMVVYCARAFAKHPALRELG